ncbi:MAG: MerR family transcriptional regulator [Ktedonobacterales bacterium]
MDQDQPILSIEELAEQAQVSPRTVRYYISEGLLPGPGARGKSASYGGDHLSRLLLIRRLLDQSMPLAEVKRVTEALAPAEVRGLLREEIERAATLERAAETSSPREYVSELLRQARARRQPASHQPRATSGPVGLFAPQTPTPSGGMTSAPVVWVRIAIVPGVELHLRADVAQRVQPELDRIAAQLRAEFDTSA